MIRLLSLNVRGLRNSKKRRGLFGWLKRYHNAQDSFVLLQETHSTPEVERMWVHEWGSPIVFSHGVNNSCGVMIIPPAKQDIDITYKYTDTNGRILIICIKTDEEVFCIVNVYGSTSNNSDIKVSILNEISSVLENMNDAHIIFGGDFNFHFDDALDRYCNPHSSVKEDKVNTMYVNRMKTICDNYNLIDMWRILNPTCRRYTWRQSNPLRQSRLDYWFVSVHLLYNIKDCDIKPSFKSDHSLISITLENKTNEKRGPGFWKFNSLLLQDEDYIGYIKGIIEHYKQIYDQVENKGTKWDIIKMEIRRATLAYSKTQANLRKDYTYELLQTMNNLETELSLNPDENLNEYYSAIKAEFEHLESCKTQGAIIRSKARYTEQGERNTKYFLNLEKRNYKTKHISKLVNDLGTEITDNKEIMNEQKNFYKKLYTSNNATLIENDIFYNNDNIPKLSCEDKDSCERDITLEECTHALNSLSLNKSPGSDGLNTEFYKFFWQDIQDLVFDSFAYAFQNGKLSIDQRRGILTLIPKKDKDLRYLKNWRPISLLNTDYKILAKLLARRLQPILGNIIHDDQVAYIKNRYIGQNIRLMSDIIEYIESNNKEGILACVDFEKAFDTVEWSFIQKALVCFGFGNKFIQWVSIFYTNITAGVLNNGYCTEFFDITRGIRQGCPISAYLFIIAAELLAIELRTNPSIKGIQIKGKEIKIMQMADDTTIFVQDLISLQQALLIFHLFFRVSGLRINKSKTTALKLGTCKKLKHKPYGLSWETDHVYSLGIWHYINLKDTLKVNFNMKLENMRKIMYMWMERDLSLKGKVTILKSLILPQILYVSSNLPVPEWFVNEAEHLMFRFLWDGKPDKIKRSVVINKIEDGGLKMPDIECMIKAQKIMWATRLADNSTGSWKVYPASLLGYISVGDMFNCTYDSKRLRDLPLFYHQIFYAWAEMNFEKEKHMNSAWEIRRELIFYNKFILINNEYLDHRYRSWYQAGVKRIHDLLDSKGNFRPSQELELEYCIPINTMMYNSVISAIPKTWKRCLKQMTITKDAIQPDDPTVIKICKKEIHINLLTNKQAYWHFVTCKSTLPIVSEAWKKDLQENTLEWNEIFVLPYKCIRETKLQSFQYRILNRIFPCNSWVARWKKSISNMCNLCSEVDTLIHYFWGCKVSKAFWNSLEVWWTCNIDNLKLTCKDIILGYMGKNNNVALNYIILQGKWYIAKQKYIGKLVDFYMFLIELKYKLKIERYISASNNKTKLFNSKYGMLYFALNI